jgi:DNA modification methylase
VIDYTTFLQSKRATSAPAGFDVAPDAIHPLLRGDQRAIVRWALRRGRAAIFADTGLGKTFDQVEWARHVAAHTGGKALLLSPLAVAHQTIREAAKLGVAVTYCRSQAEADTADSALIITNYDMVKAFDPARFAGVVLDESSILKAFSGATKKLIVKMFAQTPYRLACTATPAPNDHMELGNHAEFLGIMQGSEMLARWFINDSMKAESYRLKHHARADFWRWVTTWAVCVGTPSDLGYSDEGFALPPLDLHEHIVAVDHTRAFESGQLFVNGALNATALWKEKAATAADRCAAAAAIVQAEPNESWVVWCDTNDEADRLQALLPAAIEVRGSETPAAKERKLTAFSDGDARIIITKADLAGFGLNWQHCARMCFVGVTYSFEKLYQALRRSYRYGQTRAVQAHLIYAESEGNVMDAIKRKQGEHAAMRAEMTQAQRQHSDLLAAPDLSLAPVETDAAAGDGWRLLLGDCVQRTAEIESDSIDFTIFSPPFAELYVYSDSEADMGNSKDAGEFMRHFAYLIPELRRVTRPGRLCAVHCKDLPTYRNRHGAPGLYDFPGELVRAFESHGWQFHSRVTIWKDPVIEAARTNNYGLLFGSFSKRAEVCRQGMADYLLVFRKHEEGMEDKQVTQARTPGDYIGTQPPTRYKDECDYAIQVWQRYASPVWFDIDQTDVLNYQIARESEDEKHLCPLQLGVIRRAIDLWTMPGEMVFSPFAGVGSEGYVALEMGRRFIGVELKRAYWQWAQRYLSDAAFQAQQPNFFGLVEEAA